MSTWWAGESWTLPIKASVHHGLLPEIKLSRQLLAGQERVVGNWRLLVPNMDEGIWKSTKGFIYRQQRHQLCNHLPGLWINDSPVTGWTGLWWRLLGRRVTTPFHLINANRSFSGNRGQQCTKLGSCSAHPALRCHPWHGAIVVNMIVRSWSRCSDSALQVTLPLTIQESQPVANSRLQIAALGPAKPSPGPPKTKLA